jgi:hypothetical protein
VQCAIDGFQKAGMFSILAHGRFTLDQLVKRVPNAKSSESQGVYVRIYIAKELMISAELSEFVIGRRVRPEKSKAFDGNARRSLSNANSRFTLGYLMISAIEWVGTTISCP